MFVFLAELGTAIRTEEMLQPGEGVKDVMPGVRELLPALQSREDMSLGLLTGNFEEAARILRAS